MRTTNLDNNTNGTVNPPISEIPSVNSGGRADFEAEQRKWWSRSSERREERKLGKSLVKN
ncbi:Rho guanine nucleotide exchange factor (GEF) 10-like isoform 1 [Corchorus capsularis]|uniref:Rho guanine nucleotide exchange factor (GEF) 10-like isoform 1 n=1 Tax=Corchorus capsularis TaxID=210143 RepID=A0A1R3IZ17_COCAP|nr:Rho guanine nucleotide exchange factor (GEF) 10-like isoform 1 [Corchorus capsularis]